MMTIKKEEQEAGRKERERCVLRSHHQSKEGRDSEQ